MKVENFDTIKLDDLRTMIRETFYHDEHVIEAERYFQDLLFPFRRTDPMQLVGEPVGLAPMMRSLLSNIDVKEVQLRRDAMRVDVQFRFPPVLWVDSVGAGDPLSFRAECFDGIRLSSFQPGNIFNVYTGLEYGNYGRIAYYEDKGETFFCKQTMLGHLHNKGFAILAAPQELFEFIETQSFLLKVDDDLADTAVVNWFPKDIDDLKDLMHPLKHLWD